jgi:hypothetical protein
MQIQIEELRRLEEQRLVPAIQAWNEAKRNLESAIALAETREKEYQALSEDVQRRLAALSVVVEMSNDLLPGGPPAKPAAIHEISAMPDLRAIQLANTCADSTKSVEKQKAAVGASSRQLFPAMWRARAQQAIAP